MTTPTRATADPTSAFTHRPAKPLPYRWWLRLTDAWAGYRDGRINLAELPAAPRHVTTQLTDNPTAWLIHNTHQYTERAERETLHHQAATADLRTQHTRLLAEIDTCNDNLTQAIQDRATLPDHPHDPTRRGPAETHTPDTVVTTRRHREHQARITGPADARISRTRAQLDEFTTLAHHVAATLDTASTITTTRQRHLAEYHQRRAQTYIRAYTRAHHKKSRITTREPRGRTV